MLNALEQLIRQTCNSRARRAARVFSVKPAEGIPAGSIVIDTIEEDEASLKKLTWDDVIGRDLYMATDEVTGFMPFNNDYPDPIEFDYDRYWLVLEPIHFLTQELPSAQAQAVPAAEAVPRDPSKKLAFID